jgi:hypothetical protein
MELARSDFASGWPNADLSRGHIFPVGVTAACAVAFALTQLRLLIRDVSA